MSWAVVLGGASGLLWGTADFAGGLLSRRLAALTVVWWSQVAGALGLVVTLAVQRTEPVPQALAWGALAGIFGGSALLLFYRGLATGVMSVVAPVSACGASLPVAVAIARGERPGTLALVGIVAMLAGITLTSLAASEPVGDDGVPSGRWAAAMPLALGAAVGFGLFFVFLDLAAGAAESQHLWSVAGARGGSLLVLTSLVALQARDSFAIPTGSVVVIACVGLADVGANVLYAMASTRGNLGVVSVLGSLYPVATVVLAQLFLGERLTWRQGLGVVLALAGVAMVSS